MRSLDHLVLFITPTSSFSMDQGPRGKEKGGSIGGWEMEVSFWLMIARPFMLLFYVSTEKGKGEGQECTFF